MTGYGKAESILLNKKVTVEVRSLNSKNFDCNTRIPGLYREKELVIRSLGAKEIVRGKTDISIYYDALEAEQNFFINKSLVKKYYEDLKDAETIAGITNDKSDYLATIMRMPEVMQSEKPSLSEEEWNLLEQLIKDAFVKFNEFRATEGDILYTELTTRIQNILDLLEQVPQFENERVDNVKDRIYKNLEESIEAGKIDKNRFEQEVIFYLEKLDITEEKVRLKAHCELFLEVAKNEENQGKKLGFVTQEIGREINTLGSKANHAEMQKIVIRMKDELEKIKEQTLNVL